jgi:tetratricopeptide (TPR) repeat protein
VRLRRLCGWLPTACFPEICIKLFHFTPRAADFFDILQTEGAFPPGHLRASFFRFLITEIWREQQEDMIDKWQETRNAAEKAQAEGKYGFAESLWYAALEETVDFEPTDRRRALSLERLCECLWYQEKFTDAVPLAQELVGIYTKVFGKEHIDTACMQANLGLLYVVQNDPVAGEPVLREALELKRRVLGASHPDVVRLESTYKDVVAKLKSQGMSPAAVVTARQWGKTGRFEALKPDAPVPAAPPVPKLSREEALKQWQPLFESAKISFDKGDWSDSQLKLTKAVDLAESFGEYDDKLCITLGALADTLLRQDKHQQAVPLFERVHKIKIHVLGKNHLTVAESANNLARCHYYYGNFEAAEKSAIECTNIYEKVMGPEDVTVATCLGNIAMLYRLNKRPADAENAYKRCLSIRTKKQGGDHPETIKLLQNYASLLRDMHREDEAEHLQACASGFVTGTWKTVEVATEQQLVVDNSDICSFCGTMLNGGHKCMTCGTDVRELGRA